MSSLGRDVADLLGQLTQGIFHVMVQAMKVDWKNESYIEIVLYGGMSTFDNARLTNLVLLCHAAAIRCELCPASPQYLRLIFYRRERDGTTIWSKHPTIQEAIETFESWNGWDGGYS